MNQVTISTQFGKYQKTLENALENLEKEQILSRIWDHDHTVWKPEPTEITNRLGWLRIANKMRPEIPRIRSLAEHLLREGYNHILLLGMGGSSLAPEVFRNTFGVNPGYMELAVLDSTDPDEVQMHAQSLDLARTLFIVSTKSGGTVETLSFFKFFYNLVENILGHTEAGSHFIAITDPGSHLETLARDLDFRDTFLNDPNIGGRYSALSFFGIVPACLIGVDVDLLLDRAITMASSDESGAILGTALGVLAAEGRDKVTFIISEELRSFGDWVEQLIAESTGKENKGLLPVVNEPLGTPESYKSDRFFVVLSLGKDHPGKGDFRPLQRAGHPMIYIQIKDVYDLGGQFFLWELGTAVASYWLKINPFDQPNVESAKVLAREMVTEFKRNGILPEIDTSPLKPETLHSFLKKSQISDYIAIQAYIQPSIENRIAIQKLRLKLRDQYKLATTIGFGPRFLHSTGQLHKGDGGNGLFVQFTSESMVDIDIPDLAGGNESSITFGTLKMAQALGDGQALRNENRRFIHFHLGKNIIQALDIFIQSDTD